MINRDLNRLNEEWSPGRKESVYPPSPAAEPGEEWTVVGCDSFDGTTYAVGRYPTFDGAMDVVRAKTAEHEKSQPGGMLDRFSAHRTRKAAGTAKAPEPGEMSDSHVESNLTTPRDCEVPYETATRMVTELFHHLAALRARAERAEKRADEANEACRDEARESARLRARLATAEAEAARLRRELNENAGLAEGAVVEIAALRAQVERLVEAGARLESIVRGFRARSTEFDDTEALDVALARWAAAREVKP